MHEILVRRYSKLQANNEPFPSLILIDGGLGQLHAAYAALESIGVTLQPLASIAKREEVIYVYGQEDDPVVLDRRSPVLHLVQRIRDESHRFAINYHRKRREMRDRDSELLEIPGVGPTTRKRLIEHFGSLRGIKAAGPDALTAVVNAATAKKIRAYFDGEREAAIDGNGVPTEAETPPEFRILQ
jgi:excinuclease ABC subunit C